VQSDEPIEFKLKTAVTISTEKKFKNLNVPRIKKGQKAMTSRTLDN
jgi:hypothetical protein